MKPATSQISRAPSVARIASHVSPNAALSARVGVSRTKNTPMIKEMSGKHAARKKATRRLRVSARYPPSTPTSTEATVMHAHWTD